MADLTPAEQQFFETGELPAELAAPAHDAVAAAGVGETSPITPPVAASSTPTPASPTPEIQPTSPTDVTEILRRSLQEAQNRQAQLEIQLAQLQKPAPQSDPAPDPNIDPLGAMMHQINQVNKSISELQTQLNSQTQQQNNAVQFDQFKAHVSNLRDQFLKTTPDFHDAYDHLRQARIADLRTFGIPEPQIQQALFQDEVALAEAAIRNGKNPAEVVYGMAKRHGYTPKNATAPAPTPADKLSNIQQAPTTLPPATPVTSDLTLDSLKNASDADLNKMVMNEDTWAKIAGKDSYPL